MWVVPYVSPGARVVAAGVSTMFGFTSFAGYFLTHLMLRDKITEVPLYQLDANALIAKSTPAVVASAMTLSQYNLGLAFDHLPARCSVSWASTSTGGTRCRDGSWGRSGSWCGTRAVVSGTDEPSTRSPSATGCTAGRSSAPA